MEDFLLFAYSLKSSENCKRCLRTAKLLQAVPGLDVRVVLFMDVLRPLPYLVELLNRMIIKAMAASLFIRNAKRNHEAWERRMSQIWN